MIHINPVVRKLLSIKSPPSFICAFNTFSGINPLGSIPLYLANNFLLILLGPDADFNGDIVITVTVTDGEYSDSLDFSKPLEIKAYQYDIVCNGIELSSGAIRNHVPELMYKLFEIAGYDKKHVNENFSGMINALSYGAPPHGGIAPGLDRIVMLLAEEKNIREVTMFPMNQNAQDLMMEAPSEVEAKQLKELGIKIDSKKN